MPEKNSIAFLEAKVKEKELELKNVRKDIHKSRMMNELSDMLTYEEVRELYLKKLKLINH